MVFTGSDSSIEDFTSKELQFTTKQKREISLQSEDTATAGSNFIIGYSMVDTEGAESKYEGRKLSLVITAPDNIPNDVNLTVGTNTYYLNSQKQFIVPLGDVQSGSSSVTMTLASNMFPTEAMEYEFDVALWISATANASSPMLGEKVENASLIISTTAELQPSLKVTNMDLRVIHKADLGNSVVATYNYIPETNCYVTVELHQKVGTAYQKITDRLNQVNNTTQHTLGVFNIDASQGSNQLTFKLSSATSISTYRLVFRVNDENGTQLLEIPYNFIVTE